MNGRERRTERERPRETDREEKQYRLLALQEDEASHLVFTGQDVCKSDSSWMLVHGINSSLEVGSLLLTKQTNILACYSSSSERPRVQWTKCLPRLHTFELRGYKCLKLPKGVSQGHLTLCLCLCMFRANTFVKSSVLEMLRLSETLLAPASKSQMKSGDFFICLLTFI